MIDFKEALAALQNLSKLAHAPSDYNIARHAANLSAAIRAALELAEREAEAWEAIEAWLGVGDERYYRSVLLSDDQRGSRAGKWRVTIKQYGQLDSLFAPSRLEALEAAAKWCREQAAK